MAHKGCAVYVEDDAFQAGPKSKYLVLTKYLQVLTNQFQYE